MEIERTAFVGFVEKEKVSNPGPRGDPATFPGPSRLCCPGALAPARPGSLRRLPAASISPRPRGQLGGVSLIPPYARGRGSCRELPLPAPGSPGTQALEKLPAMYLSFLSPLFPISLVFFEFRKPTAKRPTTGSTTACSCSTATVRAGSPRGQPRHRHLGEPGLQNPTGTRGAAVPAPSAPRIPALGARLGRGAPAGTPDGSEPSGEPKRGPTAAGRPRSSLLCLVSGIRTEQDFYVRLIDSMTKQVRKFPLSSLLGLPLRLVPSAGSAPGARPPARGGRAGDAPCRGCGQRLHRKAACVALIQRHENRRSV